MTLLSLGDLSTAFRAQLHQARVKTDLSRLAEELASGRTTDLRATTGGDLGRYAGLDTALTHLAAFDTAAAEARTFAEAQQRSLGTVQDVTSDLAPALLLAGTTRDAAMVQSVAVDARARFETAVSALNTKVADRALFAGTAIGGTALTDASDILADLQAAAAAETTAAGVEAVVDAWFDDAGGGFETTGYRGATQDLAAWRIGPDESVEVTLRADDGRIRDVLKGYALAALVAEGTPTLAHDERVALIAGAGERLLAGDKALTELRAGLGATESRIETATARNAAETAALEIARSDLVAVDPYKTATRLQTAETQLQTLYTITARLSRLNLADFLR